MKRIGLTIAIALLGTLLAFGGTLAAQQGESDVALRLAIETETVKGDLRGAIEQYKKLAKDANRAIAAQALLRLAECYQKLGDAQAKMVYERVVKEFADQTTTAGEARTRLAAMGNASTPSLPPPRLVGAGWGYPNPHSAMTAD